MRVPSQHESPASLSGCPEHDALARVRQSLTNARFDRKHYGLPAETVNTLESVVERFEALIARKTNCGICPERSCLKQRC